MLILTIFSLFRAGADRLLYVSRKVSDSEQTEFLPLLINTVVKVKRRISP